MQLMLLRHAADDLLLDGSPLRLDELKVNAVLLHESVVRSLFEDLPSQCSLVGRPERARGKQAAGGRTVSVCGVVRIGACVRGCN
eukprot:1577164-Pleurochrysis_carterae.AAC.1